MKGICFKEPLFRATIDGRKTQTRRIMKPQPETHIDGKPCIWREKTDFYQSGEWVEVKPRYKVGEVVYLKEPYFLYDETEYLELKTTNGLEIAYKYGNGLSIEEITGKSSLKWKNKLFMPEYAARYFIKIIAVRAERLQDISESDCFKEGIIGIAGTDAPAYKVGVDAKSFPTPRKAYAALIDQINGLGTWDSNPFVFVYDYILIKP